jgi:transglutaminase-like putative cysteine protease
VIDEPLTHLAAPSPVASRSWRIHHRTSYTYAAPARESFNEIRLAPVTNKYQTLRSFSLAITPSVPIRQYIDFCSNTVHHFDIPLPHQILLVESRAVVATHPPKPLPENTPSLPLAQLPRAIMDSYCYDYLGASRFVDLEAQTWRLAVDATVGVTDSWPAVLAIMRFVHGWLAYTPASTHVHTHIRDLLTHRRGVCQDFAHLMCGLCRSLKIPARYVSGYLADEQARATHAWLEVFLPDLGWLPMDPTHNRQIDNTYVKIAAGRDYADVPPITGSYKGSLNRKMEVDVNIEAL